MFLKVRHGYFKLGCVSNIFAVLRLLKNTYHTFVWLGNKSVVSRL